jgi:hypothetical protein
LKPSSKANPPKNEIKRCRTVGKVAGFFVGTIQYESFLPQVISAILPKRLSKRNKKLRGTC